MPGYWTVSSIGVWTAGHRTSYDRETGRIYALIQLVAREDARVIAGSADVAPGIPGTATVVAARAMPAPAGAMKIVSPFHVRPARGCGRYSFLPRLRRPFIDAADNRFSGGDAAGRGGSRWLTRPPDSFRVNVHEAGREPMARMTVMWRCELQAQV